jgi:hypothetical protein
MSPRTNITCANQGGSSAKALGSESSPTIPKSTPSQVTSFELCGCMVRACAKRQGKANGPFGELWAVIESKHEIIQSRQSVGRSGYIRRDSQPRPPVGLATSGAACCGLCRPPGRGFLHLLPADGNWDGMSVLRRDKQGHPAGYRCDGCGRFSGDRNGYYFDKKLQSGGTINSKGRECQHDFCRECESKNSEPYACPKCGALPL